MYCRECGQVIANENAVICVKCGTKKGHGNKFCYNCGAAVRNENAEYCLECGVSLKKSSVFGSNGAKNKVAAGLLALFVGAFGIHRFYLGYNNIGIIQLVLTLAGFLTCGITTLAAQIWAIVDCVLIFTDKLPEANGAALE